MRFHGMTQCCLLLSVGCLVSPVRAATSLERVAISLSGQDCPSFSRTVAAALAQVPGVSHVDSDSVPDHVLVDVASALATPEALLEAAARGIEPRVRCQVDIMRSCITAAPSSPRP